VYVEKAPCKEQIRATLFAIKAEGIRSIAVALLHSYLFKDHEEMVLAEATSPVFGDWFEQISLSSHVMPMARLVPRGCTTCVDAYLTPVIKTYLASFVRGFDDDIKVSWTAVNTRTRTYQSSASLLSLPVAINTDTQHSTPPLSFTTPTGQSERVFHAI